MKEFRWLSKTSRLNWLASKKLTDSEADGGLSCSAPSSPVSALHEQRLNEQRLKEI